MEAFSVEESILDGENIFKELLDFVMENSEEMDSYEIETGIFSKLMKIGLAAMKCYFAQKGTGDKGEELFLEDGTKLKRQNTLRGRDYFSVFGKLKVPRTYYYEEGKNGVMPLDVEANLPERCYSYLLQEWMDLFSIRHSFNESQLSLEKLLGLKVSKSRFEVISRESSVSYDSFYATKDVVPSNKEGAIEALGFDGKGVPVIKSEAAKIQGRLGKGQKRQKKKEALVGVSYTVDKQERTAEEVAERLIYPERAKEKESKKERENEENTVSVKAKNIRRMASLARAKEEVVEEIIRDATRRDPEHKRDWVVLMDGALYLWSLLIKLLKGVNVTFVLDIIHVLEYLWLAGNALYGEKSPEGQKWIYNRLLCILRGNVGRVIGGLKQILKKQKLKSSQIKALEDTIRYFENHKEFMMYDKYLKNGYPIGTGVIESTCGHTVKDRMEGSGRRWSIDGAESTLLLRSIYTSKDWDAYWKAHMSNEKKRIYGNIIDATDSSDIKSANSEYNVASNG